MLKPFCGAGAIDNSRGQDDNIEVTLADDVDAPRPV